MRKRKATRAEFSKFRGQTEKEGLAKMTEKQRKKGGNSSVCDFKVTKEKPVTERHSNMSVNSDRDQNSIPGRAGADTRQLSEAGVRRWEQRILATHCKVCEYQKGK